MPADPDIRGPPDEQVLVRFALLELLFRYHWEKTRRHQLTPPIPDPHNGLIHGGGDDDDDDNQRAMFIADEEEDAATTSVDQDLQFSYMPGRVVAPTSKRTQGTNGRVATPTTSGSRSYVGSSVSSSQGSSSHGGSAAAAYMDADDDDNDLVDGDLIIYQSGGRQTQHRSAAAAALDEDDEFSRGMSTAAKRRFGTYDI